MIGKLIFSVFKTLTDQTVTVELHSVLQLSFLYPRVSVIYRWVNAECQFAEN